MDWKTLYVFISSTFNDMHAERDLLVKRVFPELKVFYSKYNIQLVDIDLRWGISREEAMHNNHVVGKCLENIDKARPLFLGLMGQRYGWQPDSEYLDTAYEQFPGLKEVQNHAYSVTEHEINHALYSQYHIRKRLKQFGPVKKALFYKRNDNYLTQMPDAAPDALRRIYSDSYEQNADFRQQMQDNLMRLEQKIGKSHQIKEYSCRWDLKQFTPELELPMICPGKSESEFKEWQQLWINSIGIKPEKAAIEDGDEGFKEASDYNRLLCSGRVSGFEYNEEDLAEVIKEDIVQVVEEEFRPQRSVLHTEVEQTMAQQEQNLFEIVQDSVFTEEDTRELDDFVTSADNKYCLLAAKSGSGKTTFLASWIKELKARKLNEQIIYRFIGCDDSSIDLLSLLRSILQEASDGKALEIASLTDEEVLLNWVTRLDALAHKKIIVVIDGIDQIESDTNLSWVPADIPDKVKLVLSMKNENEHSNSLEEEVSKAHKLLTLSQLSEDKKRFIITHYLEQYLKQLDEDQINEVLQLKGVQVPGAPLYLKVLLSELRVFGSFFQLMDHIRNNWGDSPQSAFKNKLQRMVNDRFYSPLPFQESVSSLMQLLANSRRGLSIEEISEGLKIHITETKYKGLSIQECRDSALLLINQMRPFINQRKGRYFFFYHSLQMAVEELWVTSKSKLYWNKILARVFDQGDEMRRFSELPYHITESKDRSLFVEKICSQEFIEGKLKAGWFHAIFGDFRNAALKFPKSKEVQAFFVFLKKHYDLLSCYQESFVQTALNEPEDSLVRSSIKFEKGDLFLQWINKADYPNPHSFTFPILEQQNGISIQEKLIVISTYRDQLVIMDRESGNVIQNKQLNGYGISMPRICGEYVFIYSGKQKSILQYDVKYFQPGKKIPVAGHIRDYRVSDSGKYIGVNYGNEVMVYSAEGEALYGMRHSSTVNEIVFSQDEAFIATASSDKTVRLSRAETGEVEWYSKKHFEEVHALCFSDDNRYLLSGSIDEVILWDVNKKKLKKRFALPIGIVSSLIFLDEREFVAVSLNGYVASLDIERGVLGGRNLNNGALKNIFRSAGASLAVVNDKNEAFEIDAAELNRSDFVNDSWMEWSCAVQKKRWGEILASFGNSNGELTLLQSSGADTFTQKSIGFFNDHVSDVTFGAQNGELKVISGDGYFINLQVDDELESSVEAGSRIAEESLHSLLYSFAAEYTYCYVSDYSGTVYIVGTGSEAIPLRKVGKLKKERSVGLFALDLSDSKLVNTGDYLYQIHPYDKEKTKKVRLDPYAINRFVSHKNIVYSLTRTGMLSSMMYEEFRKGFRNEAKLDIDLRSDCIVDFDIIHDDGRLIFITQNGLLVIYSLQQNSLINISKMPAQLKKLALSSNNEAMAISGSNGFKAVIRIAEYSEPIATERLTDASGKMTDSTRELLDKLKDI